MLRNHSFFVASLAAGLCVPAYAADPVPSAAPAVADRSVTLGLGAVPLSFDLPGLELGAVATSGEFPTTVGGDADGLGVAVSIGGQIGTLGGVPLFAEFAAAFADANGTRRDVQQLGGDGAFALRFGATTGDAVDLTTATTPAGTAATGTVTVTDPAGGTATVTQTTFSPAGLNLTNNFAESSTTGGGGLAFTNVATNGATLSSTAIGFAGDGDGFVLAATGDLSGIAIGTTVLEDVDYTELEARLVAAVPVGSSGWVATPSIAPTYRYLDRDIDVRTDVFLPINPTTDSRAAVSVATTDDLTAHYAGGSLGLGAVGPVPGGLILSVGANAGLLGMFADYSGTASATVFGIDTTTIAFDPVSDELDELAYFARASFGVTKQLGALSLSFGAQAEYLSDVPTVRRDPGVALDGSSALSVSGGNGSVRLDTDDAVILSGSVSVALTF